MEVMQLLHCGVGGGGLPMAMGSISAQVCFWVLSVAKPIIILTMLITKVFTKLLLFVTPRTFIFHIPCFWGDFPLLTHPDEVLTLRFCINSDIQHPQLRTVANSLYP